MIVGDLLTLLEETPGIATRDGAFRATMLLAKLTGLLRIHFAQEDKQLYPSLKASSDPAVAATAVRFFDEMGGIGPVYGCFAQKWSGTEAVLGNGDAFRRECREVMAVLAGRVQRENDELYPMADAAFEIEKTRVRAA
jgi:hypothetical protein